MTDDTTKRAEALTDRVKEMADLFEAGGYALYASDLRALLAERQGWRPISECEWEPDDDEFCPGTWDGACGIKWTFTDGGPAENDVQFCMRCGGRVVIPSPPTGAKS